MKPSTKACFLSSSHATLQPVHLPASHLHHLAHLQHILVVLQVKGAELFLSLGLRGPTSLFLNPLLTHHPTALLLQREPPPEAEHHPSAPRLLTDPEHPRVPSKLGYHSQQLKSLGQSELGSSSGDLLDHKRLYQRQTAAQSPVTVRKKSIPPHPTLTPCMEGPAG